MISRDFFSSPDLTDQPWWAQLLFAGMVVFADDAGVIRADPMFLRNAIIAPTPSRRCPTIARIQHVLRLFVVRRMLTERNYEGVSCYEITNFARFQRLKRREGKRREDEDEGIAHHDDAIPSILTQEAHDIGPLLEGYAFEFKLGRPKAAETMMRLKPTELDLEAWRKLRPVLHEKTFRWAIQQFRSPSEFGAYRARLEAEDATDSSRGSSEDRRESVLRKRSSEILEDIGAAAKGATPPPPEFFEAYKKLKEQRATQT